MPATTLLLALTRGRRYGLRRSMPGRLDGQDLRWRAAGAGRFAGVLSPGKA
ncbi:MAG: hypothetical protein V4454_15400 [Pseudomonadota bacterium]